jgi:hypothetical protein
MLSASRAVLVCVSALVSSPGIGMSMNELGQVESSHSGSGLRTFTRAGAPGCAGVRAMQPQAQPGYVNSVPFPDARLHYSCAADGRADSMAPSRCLSSVAGSKRCRWNLRRTRVEHERSGTGTGIEQPAFSPEVSATGQPIDRDCAGQSAPPIGCADWTLAHPGYESAPTFAVSGTQIPRGPLFRHRRDSE